MNRKKKQIYILMVTIIVILFCCKLLIQNGVLASIYVFILCQCNGHIIANFLRLPVISMNKSFEKPLVEALRYENNTEAYYTLLAIDPPPLEALRKAMKNKNPRIRKESASLLGKFRDLNSVDILVSALEDSDEGVQYEAIYALEQIGDKKAYKYIIKKVNHKNHEIRSASLSALMKLREDDNEIYMLLKRALSDPNYNTRNSALFHLKCMGTIEAYKIVGLALKDPSRQNRIYAIEILGYSQNKKAVNFLKKFIKTTKMKEEKNKALEVIKRIENNK